MNLAAAQSIWYGVDRGWTRPPVHGFTLVGVIAVGRIPPMAAAGTFSLVRLGSGFSQLGWG